MFVGKKGVEFRKQVQLKALRMKTLMNPLEVRINIFPPDKRKRDIDNVLKCLLDAMEKAKVYKNDNQIIRL